MVEPIITGTAASKGFEAAASMGVEAAKGAAESVQASSIPGAGGGGGFVPDPVGGGDPLHGLCSAPANFTGGPMPEGFVPNPMGGGTPSIEIGVAEKTGAPQEKSLIEKMNDFYKSHKDDIKSIKDKIHTVVEIKGNLNHVGTDLMGPDAKRYDPETNLRSSRWGKW